jgi:hypothetical protein
MQYVDFNWELDAMGLRLDRDLDVQKLGWKEGDFFKLIQVDGQLQLVKIDPLETFVRGMK